MTPTGHSFVVDASVAVKLALPEALSDRAETLFGLLTTDPPVRLFVPDLFYIESANVFWKADSETRRDFSSHHVARQLHVAPPAAEIATGASLAAGRPKAHHKPAQADGLGMPANTHPTKPRRGATVPPTCAKAHGLTRKDRLDRSHSASCRRARTRRSKPLLPGVGCPA